jgi:hypothetical protein
MLRFISFPYFYSLITVTFHTILYEPLSMALYNTTGNVLLVFHWSAFAWQLLQWKINRCYIFSHNFHIHAVHLDIIKVFSFTNRCTSELRPKTILKCALKLALKLLRHVSVHSHHYQGVHYSWLLKLQLLKQPIKIHRCVVMWLHILVGPCWFVYAALFGSRLS